MVDFQPISICCKATLILGIITTVILLAGRRWPQLSTAWQRVGVVALLALPFATWVFPALQIPVLPSGDIANTEPVNTAIEVREIEPINALSFAAETEQPIAFADSKSGWQPFVEPNSLRVPVPVREALVTQSVVPDIQIEALPPEIQIEHASAVIPPTESLSSTRNEHVSQRPFWIVCLATAYGTALIILVVRLFAAWRGLHRLKRSSVYIADPVWTDLLQDWRDQLRIRRPVELRESTDVSVPMTFGWYRPVILVPRDCVVECSSDQRQAILIHELTHIARGDFFWQILTQLTTSMYWIHPLAWFVRREGESLRERLCDQFCSQILGRDVYAKTLVEIAARLVHRHHAGIGIAMAQRSSLVRRLNELDKMELPRKSRAGRTTHLVAVATAVCTMGLLVVGMLTQHGSKPSSDQSISSPVAETESAGLAKQVPAITSEEDTISIHQTSVFSSLPTQFQGVVVDRFGVAIPNAAVTLTIHHLSDPYEHNQSDRTLKWTATSDEKGAYTIETGDLELCGPHDTVTLEARRDGYLRQEARVGHKRLASGTLPRLELFADYKPTEVSAPVNAIVNDVIRRTVNRLWEPNRFSAQDGDLAWPDDTEEFNAGVAAVVNDEPILNGQILEPRSFYVKSVREQMLKAANDPKPRTSGTAAPTFADLQKFRLGMIQSAISPYVQKKILVQRLIASKTPDQLDQMNQHIDELFELEVQKLKLQHKADTEGALKARLLEKGTNLRRVKESFTLEQLTSVYMATHRKQPIIQEQDIVDYYQAHAMDYKTPASATWQKIAVDISPDCEKVNARKILGEFLACVNQGESPADVVRKLKSVEETKIHNAIATSNRSRRNGGNPSWILLASSPAPLAVPFVGNTLINSGFYVNNIHGAIDAADQQAEVRVNNSPVSVAGAPVVATVDSGPTPEQRNCILVAPTIATAVPPGGTYTKEQPLELNSDSTQNIGYTIRMELTAEGPKWTAIPVSTENIKGDGRQGDAKGATGNHLSKTEEFKGQSDKFEMTQLIRSATSGATVSAGLTLQNYQGMTKGSLANAELEALVFSLPLKEWSQIIERPDALCVIYVSNRTAESQTPIDEVKERIREILLQKLFSKNTEEIIKEAFSGTVIKSEYDIALPD